MLFSLETRQFSTLIPQATGAQYLPTRGAAGGHIVYGGGNTLMAVPFDPATREIQGQAVPVAENWAAGASSTSGTYVYNLGIGVAAANRWPLSWLRRNATESEPLLEMRANYVNPQVSPDGRRLAVVVGDAGQQSILVYDLINQTSLPLTQKGESGGQAVWTPDSQYLVWRTGPQDGPVRLVWRRADGSGVVHTLLDVPDGGMDLIRPEAIAPDGKHILFLVLAEGTGADEWVADLDLSTPGEFRASDPRPLVETLGVDYGASFSPDGKWILYSSDESGLYETYVQPFPGPGGRRKVVEGPAAWPECPAMGGSRGSINRGAQVAGTQG